MTDIKAKASSEPVKRLPNARTIQTLILRIVDDEARTRHTAQLLRTALWPVVAICVIGAAVLTVAIIFYPLSTVSAVTGFGAVGGAVAWRRRRSS
jgi:MYXO-CTERM domain-containing protein